MAAVMEKLDIYLKLTKKSVEAVRGMSPQKFNNEQCRYLVDKLEVAVQSASSFLEHSGAEVHGHYLPVHIAGLVETFELLLALAKQIESFLEGCCKEAWLRSAMTLVHVAEYVSSLGFNLELCRITLGKEHGARGSLTLDEVEKMCRDEVELVEKKALVDAESLRQKVTLELTSSSADDCNLAKYLLHRLVRVGPNPTSEDESILLKLFEWVTSHKRSKQLGKGASGTVYKVMWLGTAAAKKTFDGPENQEFLEEVKILSQLYHPNITSLFCCNMNMRSCSIIMELMDGNLHDLMQSRLDKNGDSPPFSILEGVDIMLQVGEGVNYLHNKRIVHRDLKSMNILVKAPSLEVGYVQAKVADFGLSRMKERSITYSNMTYNAGTSRWMAPELIKMSGAIEGSFGGSDESVKHKFKCDVYSFAMVCFEILTGQVPFVERNVRDVKEEVLKGSRPRIPDYCPSMLKSLIEECWSQEPMKRPRMGDVCAKLKYLKYLLMANTLGEEHATTVADGLRIPSIEDSTILNPEHPGCSVDDIDILESYTELVENVAHLGGLEESSAHVNHMLHKMEGNVRVVGICGTSGIGKTTLARHVFNQEQSSFTNFCFLKDVKEAKGDAVKNLQVKMLKDLAHEDVYDSALWYQRIWNRRVLLVIDNIVEELFDELVPDLDQLGRGSEVLITSCNEDVLKSIMRDIPESEVYQVHELSYSDSLQLFTWYAFRKNDLDAVDACFHKFVKEITGAYCGLPLALEVMGGFLADKMNLPSDEKHWNEAIYALKSNKEIISKLRISYDSLEENCKEMFLDVACFMVGHPTKIALEALESSDLFDGAPRRSLDQLIRRCLVKVDSDKELSMHDVVREMGRNIVMERALHKPEMVSHVWEPKIAAEVLQKKQGWNEALRALRASGVDPHIGSEAETYARLRELKYLSLDGCSVEGDFSKWSRELVWLQWRFYPGSELHSSLRLPNLAVLDLASSSNLSHLWSREFETESFYKELRILILSNCAELKEMPENITKLVNLKVLNLKGCKSLDSLPESLSDLCNLEELNLSGCRGLQKLPASVAGLQKLRVLDMRDVAVARLPVDIGGLLSLTKVDLSRCMSLEELPESFSDLSNLEELNLSGCWSIRKLPASVASLQKLRVLDISCTDVARLPVDIGGLLRLTKVDLSGCSSLEELPESFSELSNLEELNLSGCRGLRKLPASVAGLQKLRFLDISDTKVARLPVDIGGLLRLTKVDLSGCSSLEELPESFSELSNLEELNLSGCRGLRKLPASVAGLQKLRFLDISDTKVARLPVDIGGLLRLTKVDLSRCERLEELPESFSDLSNLEELNLSGCRGLQKLPASVAGLQKLRVLVISDTKVARLPVDIGGLLSLTKVDLSRCMSLEELPESFSDLSNLEELNLSGCCIRKLPASVASLQKLRVLDISCTDLARLPVDIGGLLRLTKVDLSGCSSLEEFPESFSELSNLEELNLSGCRGLRKLPASVAGLQKLRVLDISDTKVARLPVDIGGLLSLTKVDLSGCGSLEELPESFLDLSNLKELNLSWCRGLGKLLASVAGLQELRVLDISLTDLARLPADIGGLLSLTKVDLSGCWSLEELPESFSDLSNLEELKLSGCRGLRKLPASVAGLQKLRVLDISDTKVARLPVDIGGLLSLTKVDLSGCGSLEELPESFLDLSNLMELNLSWCRGLGKLLASVAGLQKLRVLDISLTDVARLPADIGGLLSLTKVDLSGCWSLEELPESFSDLSNLEELNLSRCRGLRKLLASVAGLQKLRVLDISDTKVARLPVDIGGLLSLTKVDFSRCERLEELPESFSDLSNLEELNLSGCRGLRKLPASVAGLQKLRVFDLSFSAVAWLLLDIGGLLSLTKVDLSGCWSLEELPESFSELSILEELNLSGCWGLRKLPASVAGLQKLRVLDLSFLAVARLPLDIGGLLSLTKVDLSGCESLEELPESFSELSNLEELKLSWCSGLRKFPASVASLQKLRVLDIIGSKIARLPVDIGGLLSLTKIDFSGSSGL